jgi:DNA-binding transcriptional LysR family regulator
VETDLPKLIWMKHRIESLLQGGKDREAIALAKKANLVCRGAAFVAWDDAEKVAITQDEVYQPSLSFRSIGHVGYALFAPAAWAKEKEKATTLLSQRPVAVPAGGEFNERFQECCEKAKLTPNLRFSCASFTEVAELVRSGHAVALLPEMAEPCLRASGVRRLEFAPMRTYRREIGIVWHPRLVSVRPRAGLVLAELKRIEA